MDLVSNEAGLWWAAISCSVAAYLVAWGAMNGVIQHRIPRILVASAMLIIAVSYWVDVFDWGATGPDMRRGAGWLLWPALGWTAWSGVMYSRKAVADAEQFNEATRGLAEGGK